MTRSSATSTKQGIPFVSKTSASKLAWKNRIRQACLSRARRPRTQSALANDDDEIMLTDEFTPMYGDSRSIVEAELQAHGVRVVTPGNKGPMDQYISKESDACVMTEEEVIALMEEIEMQWKQQQEHLLDKELSRLEEEDQAILDSVADYEQWEDQTNRMQVVPCPICLDASLTTAQSTELGEDIVCPNHMDGSCPLILWARPGMTLDGLRESLAQSISAHTEACSHSIVFQVHKGQIWSTCSFCGTETCII